MIKEQGSSPKPETDVAPPSGARRWALPIGFGVIALGILALLIAIYWQLAYPILWAATLAVLFFPVHRVILRAVGGRVRLSALISTLLTLAVVFIPSVIAVVHLLHEAQNLWPTVRSSLGQGGFEQVARILEESRFRGLAHLFLGGGQGTGAEALESRLAELSYQVQGLLLNALRSVTRSVPAALLQLFVTILSFYFFLQHGIGWAEQIENVLPLEREHAKRLVHIFAQTINAVFRGVILTALTQATLAGLGYWVAGVPTPVLLSLVTFVAAMVPFIGPVVVWLPAAIGLYLAGRVGAAIGLALWGTLVVSLVDNFLKPYLIGREMRMPVLWLFLAILGGLKLFGFLGVVLGPAVLALALACARIYREGRSLETDQPPMTTRRPS